MRQTLFEVFGCKFHAYPVMVSIAFVVCTLLAVREGDKRNLRIPPEGGLWVFLGALIGARAFHIIQYDTVSHIWAAVLFWQPGLVFYGGLIGGAAAAFLYATYYKMPRIKTGDVIVPYLALGEAITRIGCFLNGCCFGMPTDMPWSVRFPAGSHAFQRHLWEHLIREDAPASLPVHPTQLYMTVGLGLIVFPMLKWVLRRQRFDGQTALSYGLLYGILRFTVEVFRGDSARSVFGMTVSQAISLGLAVFSITMLVAMHFLSSDARKRPEQQSAADSSEGLPETRDDAQGASPVSEN